MVAFAEALGYVRFFHPSTESLGTDVRDWEALAIEGTRRIESGGDPAGAIRALLGYYAPTFKIWRDGEAEPEAPRNIPSGANQVIIARLVTKGFPATNRFEADPMVQGIGDPLPDFALTPVHPIKRDLPGGWHFSIANSLYATRKRIVSIGWPTTLPPGGKKPEFAVGPPPPEDRWGRLGTTIMAWNAMCCLEPEPFPGVTEDVRRQALLVALRESALASGDDSMVRALRRMIGQFNDGHGNAWTERRAAKGSVRMGVPAARFMWAGEDLVVSKVDPGVSPLRVGDMILEIDGAILSVKAREACRLVEGTQQFKRLGSVQPVYGGAPLLLGPVSEALRVKVVRGGIPLALEVPRLTWARSGVLEGEPEPGRQDPIQVLGQRIAYIDLTSTIMKRALVPPHEGQLKTCTGAIFDLRGYPCDDSLGIITAWVNGTYVMPTIRYPRLVMPNAEAVTYETRRWGNQSGLAHGPFLADRVIFLADARTLSAGETIVGMIKGSRLGTIVGDTTGGANGNRFDFKLPGGFCISRTGLSVLQPDGSQLNGVGIAPDLRVVPTAKGIAAGRDEVLDAAMGLLCR